MAFLVGAIIYPTLVVLISMVIRRYKAAPVTSAADFVGLAILFDGLLLVDPSQVLTHVKIDFGPDIAISTTLIFLAISFGIWYFCLFEVEPRITEYYLRQHAFPLNHLLATWAASLAIIALQIAFFTGRVALWAAFFTGHSS
jgi:hypothetical protein